MYTLKINSALRDSNTSVSIFCLNLTLFLNLFSFVSKIISGFFASQWSSFTPWTRDLVFFVQRLFCVFFGFVNLSSSQSFFLSPNYFFGTSLHNSAFNDSTLCDSRRQLQYQGWFITTVKVSLRKKAEKILVDVFCTTNLSQRFLWCCYNHHHYIDYGYCLLITADLCSASGTYYFLRSLMNPIMKPSQITFSDVTIPTAAVIIVATYRGLQVHNLLIFFLKPGTSRSFLARFGWLSCQ